MSNLKFDEGGKPQRNTKVMVYVAPTVHEAMEHLAVDEHRSTSSIYVEAAIALLQARGRPVVEDLASTPPPTVSAASKLARAIERQDERIEEIHAAIVGAQGSGRRDGQGPAGTKVAEAMKVVLGILKGAGVAGMLGRDLDAAARATGVRSGTVETAKAALRGAGLVRCEGKHWYLDGA